MNETKRLLCVLAHSDTETSREVFGCQTFYRVYSMENGGRGVEQDLFDGIP